MPGTGSAEGSSGRRAALSGGLCFVNRDSGRGGDWEQGPVRSVLIAAEPAATNPSFPGGRDRPLLLWSRDVMYIMADGPWCV